jgi:hypothetical protein
MVQHSLFGAALLHSRERNERKQPETAGIEQPTDSREVAMESAKGSKISTHRFSIAPMMDGTAQFELRR